MNINRSSTGNTKVLEEITLKTRELREMLSTIDKRTAIPAFLMLQYCSLMTSEYKFDTLLSTVMQTGYVIRLLLSSKGNCEISTSEIEDISSLLNEIQRLYGKIHDGNDLLTKDILTENQKKALIAQACFASKFYNTELLYQEQELDRIERVFSPFEKQIIEHEGFSIEQVINFYIDTNRIAFAKAEMGFKRIVNGEPPSAHSISLVTENYDEQFFMPLSLHETYQFSSSDYTLIDSALAEELLNKFSVSINSDFQDQELVYYCQYDNPLMKKPLIMFPNGKFMLFYNIQLAVAIYHYLEELTYIKGESLSRSKSKAIESKTCELVSMLDKDGLLFCNYAISPHGDEKDVLFISKDKVFIIECKSNKLRKYSRDKENSYHIIKQQFEKSILEGYEQATEVLNVLKSQHTVLIYEKDSDTVMWKVDTTQFKELHIVIVTQERYSLIQNNPSLLLAQDIEVVPSCFCIDDLETILLTFSRMCNPIKDFCEYLSVKEKLSSRLIYEDELDLAGKFLLERSSVIQCLQDNHLYTIDNSYSNFFDIMYNQFSLGFEKELNILGKLHVSEQGIEMYKECKRIGLKFWPEMEKFCESILNEQSKTKVEEFD